MNFDYDENLTHNPFYKALKFNHEILIETASVENWIICVPRAGCFEKSKEIFDNDFILSHILVPNDELPGSHFTNLLSNNVIVDNKRLLVVNKSKNELLKDNIAILFEEIIYKSSNSTNAVNKFKLWCLDSPLCFNSDDDLVNGHANITSSMKYYNIDSFLSAKNFLESEFVKSKFVLKRIQKMCLDIQKERTTTLDWKELYDTTKGLLNRVLNLLLNSNTCIKKQCKCDGNYLKMLKIAIEIYTINFLYSYLFDQISVISAGRSANLNRKIRNYNLYRLEEGVATNEVILRVARKLQDIDCQTTVYNKLATIKDALNLIPAPQRDSMSSDDLLDILVNAVLYTDSPFWYPTVTFLQRFVFTEKEGSSYSENSYLITTLEAAVEFLDDRPLYDELGFKSQDGSSASTSSDEEQESLKPDEKREFLKDLFHYISTRNERAVLSLLKQLKETTVLVVKNLCHPLCDCLKCQDRITKETLTINSQEPETGDGVLHKVSKFGSANVMKFLLSEFPDLDLSLRNLKAESCVHLTARFGQQNMLFQLIHETNGSTLKEVDQNGNTPLQLATQMGHLSCVKAILYFAEHKQYEIDVNSRNHQGNTCLHEAAFFGFTEIVHTLLEFKARKDLKNNVGKSASQVAFNSEIQALVKDELAESGARLSTIHLRPEYTIKYRLSVDQVEKMIQAIGFGDINSVYFMLKIDPLDLENTEHSPYLTAWINSWTMDAIRPIHAVLKYNNLELARFFSKHDVDLNVKTKTQFQTPFHYAAQQREIDACQFILGSGSNAEDLLDEQDVNGNTVLHLAIMSGNFKLIDFLMKFKLNFLISNRDGKTAVYLARKLFYLDLVQKMDYLIQQQNTDDPVSFD